MVKFFNYNNQTGSLELNKEEILLLKEFNDLMESERNKCPEDPAGRFKLRAFREFKYIYLMLDLLYAISLNRIEIKKQEDKHL